MATVPAAAPPSGKPTAAAAAAPAEATPGAAGAATAAPTGEAQPWITPQRTVPTGLMANTSTTFHVTGFGPFHGVTDNPSARLVEALPAALAQSRANLAATGYRHPGGWPVGRPVLASTTILTVSTAAVDAKLAELYAQIAQDRAAAAAAASAAGDDAAAAAAGRIVVVHFGVDTRAPCFHLEAVAVNEARFGVPDEASARPWGCSVVSGDAGDDEGVAVEGAGTETPTAAAAAGVATGTRPSLPAERRSRLPLGAILRTLQMQGWPVSISDNAGRFVCNWTYYRSLVHVARLDAAPAAAVPAAAQVAGGVAAATVGTGGTISRGPAHAAEGSGGAGGSGDVGSGMVGSPPRPPPPDAAAVQPPVAALFVHVPAARNDAVHELFAQFGAALLEVIAATVWA